MQRSLVTHFDLFADDAIDQNDEKPSVTDSAVHADDIFDDPVLDAFSALLACIRSSAVALEESTWPEEDQTGPPTSFAVPSLELLDGDVDTDHEAWLVAWRARFRDVVPTVEDYSDTLFHVQHYHNVWTDFDMYLETWGSNNGDSDSDDD